MSGPRQLRILIADDHFVVRMGLIALVGTEPDMEVVAEAADGAQAVELYGQHEPDLVLMDSRMPVMDGIEAAASIRERFPDAAILMLSAFDGDADIRRALDAGVRGYVLKSAVGEELIPGLRAVAAGKRWVPKEVASRLASRTTFEQLTPREAQVLNELARGLANKQIADVLNISEHTVKDHLKNILAKLQVAHRTEAVTVALQRGIIHI